MCVSDRFYFFFLYNANSTVLQVDWNRCSCFGLWLSFCSRRLSALWKVLHRYFYALVFQKHLHFLFLIYDMNNGIVNVLFQMSIILGAHLLLQLDLFIYLLKFKLSSL